MFDYELGLIASPELNETELEGLSKTIESLISSAGEKTSSDAPKRMRLAYPIKKKSEAFFLVFGFKAEPGKIIGLKTGLEKEKNILRFLIILKEVRKEKGFLKREAREMAREKSVEKMIKKEKAEMEEIEEKIEDLI